MKAILDRLRLPLLATGVAICILSTDCTGRTVDNMQPTGDTVEVVISTPEEIADTLPATNEALLNAEQV